MRAVVSWLSVYHTHLCGVVNGRQSYRRAKFESPFAIFLMYFQDRDVQEGADMLMVKPGMAYPVSYTHLTLPTTPYV